MDGGEGGTGAAPLEFSASVGTPLLEGLSLVHRSLVGAGLRSRTRIICSGKVTGLPFAIATSVAAADAKRAPCPAVCCCCADRPTRVLTGTLSC